MQAANYRPHSRPEGRMWQHALCVCVCVCVCVRDREKSCMRVCLTGFAAGDPTLAPPTEYCSSDSFRIKKERRPGSAHANAFLQPNTHNAVSLSFTHTHTDTHARTRTQLQVSRYEVIHKKKTDKSLIHSLILATVKLDPSGQRLD